MTDAKKKSALVERKKIEEAIKASLGNRRIEALDVVSLAVDPTFRDVAVSMWKRAHPGTKAKYCPHCKRKL